MNMNWRKNRNRRGKIPVRGLPAPIMKGLAEAEKLSERGRHLEARAALESLDERFPDRIEILTNLYNECIHLRDTGAIERAAAKLMRLDPNDQDLTISLAGAYLANHRLALALRGYRRYVERWPEGRHADHARDAIGEIEPHAIAEAADYGFTGDDAMELSELHQESQSLLARHELDKARAKINQLIQRRPDFISALNNLSLIAMAEGKLGEAIATAERVLALSDENFHALANLVRFHVLCGRMDEARTYAERLKAIDWQIHDAWPKKSEAFAFFGDDAGALEVARTFEREAVVRPQSEGALIHHLAAVAAMRMGDEKEAHRLWRRTLEIAPGFELAEANLADLRNPSPERHAPWPFKVAEWVRRETIDELVQTVKSARNKSDREIERIRQRFFEKHPEMNVLIPILLERGDPMGREFAIRMSEAMHSPAILAALGDFALSQHGPDALRFQAAQTAVKSGSLEVGVHRFWVNGEWTEMHMFGFEITPEAVVEINPKVKPLVGKALEAIKQRHDGVEAEKLMKQALAIEPDNPMFLNNLAKAYSLQGRSEEANALIHQIHARFPDYLFGRISVASLKILNGELDAAEELLKPLYSRKQMHYSEYAAFVSAQIELALARRNRKSARSWFEMWERIDPDNPNLERFRARVTSTARSRTR
ncbi:MAG: tetratricopeptide repeat protein [Blastocatellia bacterium]